MRYGLIVVGILAFVHTLQSITFHRTFGLSNKKPDNTGRIQRKHGILTRIARIGAIPRIPPQPIEESKRIVPQKDVEDFNICKIQEPCANNGLCIPEGNSFYCECPRSFYGHKCELVADDSECANNLCENNSTCYSIRNTRTAFGLLQNSTGLQINYMCWCKKGFTGDFCDYTTQMRQCAEDVCNHHGIVDARSFHNECKCHCEKNYLGEHCEIVSPCRDFECINGGVCKLNATGHPYCQCSDSLQLSPNAAIFGDHCENVWFPDTVAAEECRPCNTSFVGFVDCLESHGFDTSLLSYWWQPCEEHLPGCFEDDLSRFNCFNDGKCVAGAEEFVNVSSSGQDAILAIPRCECPTGFEGMFCERRALNLCEKLTEEEVCVHGKCSFNVSTASTHCICDSGYYGIRCELQKPCISHFCGDAMCIELPVSEASEETFPVCVCNTNQIVDNITLRCSNPHFNNCFDEKGESRCKNNGYCYPCLQDNDKNSVMNGCNEEEWRRRFRCICPTGLAPPFCDRKIGPCDLSRCMNNAKCVPISNSTLEYRCECLVGYSGQFCQISEGACSQFGHICKNGVCRNNIFFRRGFECECDDDFDGIDCDYRKTQSLIDRYNVGIFCFMILVQSISTSRISAKLLGNQS